MTSKKFESFFNHKKNIVSCHGVDKEQFLIAADMMDYDLKEHKFQCPYCRAQISVFLDPSVPKQKYYEDCEVCCNSIEISYEFSPDGELIYFNAACEE